LKKADIKGSLKQQFREPKIIFEIAQEDLERKIKLKTKTTQNFSSVKSAKNYESVEKSLIKDAFFNLKKRINHKSLHDLSLKNLLKVFDGLIGKQVLQKAKNQSTISIPHSSTYVDYAKIRTLFEVITVEDNKNMILEPKTPSLNERILIIRKTKWTWLKKEAEKIEGRIPDYLVFIKVLKTKPENSFKNLKSTNLEKNLSIIKEWVSNYNDEYSTEIIGWLEGRDIEELNDSDMLQPQCVTIRKSAFWCITNDPILKPINEFWKVSLN
jgi:hypothetical protein